MRLFTIGFTKKSAEEFFSALQTSGVERLIDVRLNNVSQLAGFAKRSDLEYFLRVICGIPYTHQLTLAPTPEMLDDYRKRDHDWDRYQAQFLDLMAHRQIEHAIEPRAVDGACLLCSEATPHRCHRRLVAEYLQRSWGNVEIIHI